MPAAFGLIVAVVAGITLPSPWSVVVVFALVLMLLLWARWPQWTEEGVEWDLQRRPKNGFVDYDQVVEVRAKDETIQPVRLMLKLSKAPVGDACLIPEHLGSDGQRKQLQGGWGAIVREKKDAIFISYDTPPLRREDCLRIHLYRDNRPVSVLRRS